MLNLAFICAQFDNGGLGSGNESLQSIILSPLFFYFCNLKKNQ